MIDPSYDRFAEGHAAKAEHEAHRWPAAFAWRMAAAVAALAAVACLVFANLPRP